MLKTMRKSVQSTFVKILLFGILIISFGLWGVTDLFVGNPDQRVVASVAGEELKFGRFNERFQQAINRSGLNNTNIEITPELSRLFEQNVLNSWAIGVILEQEISSMRLVVSDDQLRQAISSNPSFRDDQGNFSRRRFENFLASRRLAETEFLASLRQDLSRNMLVGTVLQGFDAPTAISRYAARYQNQYRRAESIEIVASPLMQIDTPTEDELRAFYDQQREFFREGEKRVVKLVGLSLEDIASSVVISHQQIDSYYADNRDQFITPESRDIERILFTTEEDARQAWVELQEGADFYALARRYAELDTKSVTISGVTLDNFADQALASRAFALDQGQISEPFQGLFGWMVLRVSEVTPELAPGIAEVEDQLRQELQREQAVNLLFDYVDQIEDLLAGGANATEIAASLTLGLKSHTIDMQNPDGKNDGLLPSQAGDLDQPGDIRLFEDNLGGYRLIELEQIIDSHIPDFADIRSAVEQAWRNDQQRALALEQARELAELVNQGQSLNQLAQTHGLALRLGQAVNRDAQPLDDSDPNASSLDATHIPALFALDANVAIALPSPQGAVVIRLAEQLEGNNTAATLRPRLQNQFASEAYVALEDDLQRRYPLTVNTEIIAQTYAEAGFAGTR